MIATTNRISSSVSRSHSVAAAASTTTDTARTAGPLVTGTASSVMPATSSGRLQRKPAEGATADDPRQSASHTGSVTLHTSTG